MSSVLLAILITLLDQGAAAGGDEEQITLGAAAVDVIYADPVGGTELARGGEEDQTQPGANRELGANNVFKCKFAQRYRAGKTGRLVAIDVLMSAGENSVVHLEILEMAFGGQYYSQAYTVPVHDNPLVPNSKSTRFGMTKMFHQVEKTDYLFFVTIQATGVGSTYCKVAILDGDFYKLGDCFASINTPGWEKIEFYKTSDLEFTTWVELASPSPSPSPSSFASGSVPSPPIVNSPFSVILPPLSPPEHNSPGLCDLCAPANEECISEEYRYEKLNYLHADIGDCQDPDQVAKAINDNAPWASKQPTYGCEKSGLANCNTIVCTSFVPWVAYASLNILQCPLF